VLSIKSNPADAQVWINGSFSGMKTPLTDWPLPGWRDGGELEIVLRKDCFNDAKVRHALGAWRVINLGILDLAPATYEIHLKSEPDGAAVWDGTRRLGSTPITIPVTCDGREVTLSHGECYEGSVKLERSNPSPFLALTADLGCLDLERGGPMVLIPAGIRMDQYEYPNWKGVQPRVMVSFGEASQLCAERERRLCTVEEFQSACRGASGNKYPYGASYLKGSCNVESDSWAREPTGHRPSCSTTEGVFDLKGNVGEWARGGEIPERGDAAVYGRPTNQPMKFSACEQYTFEVADQEHPDIGFRCCRP
jgi:hypothetical protein